MTFTDIRNNYWDVLDTNHGTRVFSSASGSYVLTSDATYVAWVAAGNTATVIDTQVKLYEVINQAALQRLPTLLGYTTRNIAGGASVTLSNPITLMQAVVTSGAGTPELRLPPMNRPDSPPIGSVVTVRNDPLSTLLLLVSDNAGGGLGFIEPGCERSFRLKANNTTAGTFDIVSLAVRTAWPTNKAIVLSGTGTDFAVRTMAAMTDGQLVVGQTGNDPLPKSISGDVAFAASGAATIANDAVTYAKMQNVSATNKLLGRTSAGAGDPEEIDIGAWTTYTPTVSSQAGTITTASATGRYKQLGKTVFLEVDITITTAGTGSGNLLATLPVTAAAANYVGASFESNITGKSGTAFIAGGGGIDATHARARDSAFATYIADGANVWIGITYEAA